jgi:hypothetical protein
VKRPFLLVCGPRGVGKSSVGFQVFFEVMQSGIKAAYVDLDQVSFCRPIEDDPDTERVKARNLARIWSVYERAGARCLVASGDVGSSDVMDAHAAAVPTLALSICRLQAHGESLKERMLTRGRGDSAQLPGDELLGESAARLTQLAEEAERPAKAQRKLVGEVQVATDGQTIAEVGARVRAELGGWPQITAA